MEDEQEIFDKLDRVAGYRSRVEPIFRSLIANTLTELPDGVVVEVGSGDGYLRSLLPEALAERVTLTEPTDVGVHRLRKRFPKAAVEKADIESLPFEDASVALVLACCVFDVLPSVSRAFDEIARVLKTGGLVVHWLDLATDLHALFGEIVEEGKLYALPNVFTDPMSAPFPEDIMLIPRAQLDMVIHILAKHPHGVMLKGYRRAFRKSAEDAVGAFSAINESNENRRALAQGFALAMKQASGAQKRELAQFAGRPISSAFVFHKRLESLRLDEFELQKCGLMHESRELESRPGGPTAYRSVVGYIQSGRAASTAPDKCLTELGVHVFRARKLSE